MNSIYSVGQVNTYIRTMFDQDFMLNKIYIKGEVSNCKYHTSGHIYFSLKDESGSISCVMFAGQRKGLGFAMKNGDKVVAGGSVSEGFKKELEINGVGYRASKEGKNLVMNLGYSHQVIVPEIDGITIDVPSANKVVISGPDKQKVGQFAAEVREKRPPEPYKGKGIKYVDEVIRRKVGKTGAKK